jgi:transcriptional regulator ATRX
MLNFVRPHIWKRAHFKAIFEDPITEGSTRNSNSYEVRMMKEATFKLQNRLLDKIVHRKGPDVLQAELPPKHEYVIKVRLTDYQSALYNSALEHARDDKVKGRYNEYLFSLVDVLRKVPIISLSLTVARFVITQI